MIPVGPFSYTMVNPFTGKEVTETITHVTFIPQDGELLVARIDGETGEVEMFPDPPE